MGGGDIYRKWGDAVNHAETEYTQFCADKEFTIPTTQCKGIKFLDAHPDYGTVDGRYYSAENYSKNKHKYYEYCKNEKGWDTKCSLSFSNSLDRYLTCTARKSASANIMSIHCAELHKEVYNELVKYGINDIRFGEIAQEYLTIIKAKHHYFADDIYNCRDLINAENKEGKSNLSESSCSRYPFLDQFIKDGVYDEFFKRAVDCLRDGMVESGCDLNPIEIEEIINITLPHASERRGFYGSNVSQNALISNKLRSNPITRTLIFPPARIIYNKFIKSGDKKIDDGHLNNLPNELKIVDTVINTFGEYHDADIPIVDVYIQSNK